MQKDIKESADFWVERIQATGSEMIELMAHFAAHHSNHDLCTHTVNVKNKTADDILEEILAFINGD